MGRRAKVNNESTWGRAIIAGIIYNLIFWAPVICALLIKFH